MRLGIGIVTSQGKVVANLAASALSTPVLIRSYQVTTGDANSLKSIRVPVFDVTGNPIIIIASQRNTSSADSIMTMTYGAAGRTFGTGTSVGAMKARCRRTSNESQIFFVLNPGVGSIEINYSNNYASCGVSIEVFEVVGATDIGPATISGASNSNARNISHVTDTANSGVLFIANRLSGDPANPITMTGTDVILRNVTTGVSLTGDMTITIGYERVDAPATAYAAISWPTIGFIATMCIQVKSQ